MKYLHLIWAELFRRKTRTLLTLVSILAAFLLFGLLNGVRVSFDQAGQSAQGAKRLQTGSKLSFIDTLPLSLNDRIARTDGVKAVTYANWFGGAYQKPENQIFSFAVAPNYLDLYPEIEVSAAQRQTFDATRTGVLVGEDLMKRFKWKGPLFQISALTREGCEGLIHAVYAHVSKLKNVVPEDPDPRFDAAGAGVPTS